MLSPVSPYDSPASGFPVKKGAAQPATTFGLGFGRLKVDTFKSVFSKPAERPTQVIASLGPASRSAEVLEKMIMAGASVFRIDFARGTHSEHAQSVDLIRGVSQRLAAAGQLKQPVRIMADLQGPRIAVGSLLFGPLALKAGDSLKISPNATTDQAGILPTTYPDLVASLQPGNRLIVNDGAVVLEVTQAAGADGLAEAKVLKGGKITSNMGINAPDAPLKTPALTEKDLADLQFALDKDFDIITQSYPGSAEDVLETRALVEESGKQPELIAKIERPQAVEPAMLRAIVKAADGVMVARGDLGTEMGVENLPRLQKRIIEEAKLQHKQVIVANKLLGSMINADQPSRSDVFDLVQAVEGGASAVMLTGETSVGQYPVEAVKVADSLVREYAPKPEVEQAMGDPLGWFFRTIRRVAHGLVDSLFDGLKLWVDDLAQSIKSKLGEKLARLGKSGRQPSA